MSEPELDEMGPIDYIVLEWPSEPLGDEVVPLLVDLVDRGIIRILDIAFISKGQDGTLTAIDINDLVPPRRPSVSWRARRRAWSTMTTSKRRRQCSSPARRRRSWSGRTAGPHPSRSRCGAPVASWSPAAASPSKRSSRRSTRSKPHRVSEPTMPGLLRGIARTAVVAGTATHVSNNVSRRQQSRWAQQGPAEPEAYAPAAAGARGRGTRPREPAQGAGRPQGAGRAHRRGVRDPEGAAAGIAASGLPQTAAEVPSTQPTRNRYAAARWSARDTHDDPERYFAPIRKLSSWSSRLSYPASHLVHNPHRSIALNCSWCRHLPARSHAVGP